MTSRLTRRTMLVGGAGLMASAGLVEGAGAKLLAGPPLAAARPHEPFSFLFITDAHIQPELNAAAGCAQCFRHARRMGADFAIQGGDHVFDALGVPAARANTLVDLYVRTEQDLGLQVHHAIGNHDCFGVYVKSGVAPADPAYGKKFFEHHFGSLFYSFDHRGVHFIMLDSIGITADRQYEGRIDPGQLAWLAADLRAVAAGTPVVVTSHIPLVTAFDAYLPATVPPGPPGKTRVLNAAEVIALFAPHNVIGVLQGHTHINETVWWRGIPFITSGAVSGNWWHGTRLGVPEGFSLIRVSNNRLAVQYETYGFHSVDPHDT